MKLRTGPWKLTDLDSVSKNGMKVFSCFHCGGGSTMGYKLAGYDVLGGVEIDPKIMAIYKKNHNPKHSYLMGVQEFKDIPWDQLPKELFNLDILDGSPPCSSFSMAGSRERDWGKKKKFREGQTEQRLDELFFDFIDIAKMLKPKVVIAENVKGLITGNARWYVKQIGERFDKAGYDVQLFLLNSAFMGVPQKRERTVFIARRRDLNLPKLTLEFNEPTISIAKALGGRSAIGKLENPETKCAYYWKRTGLGQSFATVHETGSYFSKIKIDPDQPTNTITGHSANDLYHWSVCARFNDDFFKTAQTFPEDYDFLDQGAGYVCGMSVPPFMMQRISAEVYRQWLTKFKTILKPSKTAKV